MSDAATPARAPVNDEGAVEPFHIGQVPWQSSSKGDRFGLRYQHLSAYGGGSQISVSMEVLEPGRQANPAHYHLVEEEQVFILEGSLTLGLGTRRYVLSAGHYACFPAGQKVGHSLTNHTDAPCRYLILGNPQPHDVSVFPDTGRVDVKLTGTGYRESATMGYWDGIDTERAG